MKWALTIGNFDGVHRGHRALVDALNQWRRERTNSHEPLRLQVVTFDPHPAEVISQKPVPRLTSTADKIRLLQNLGVDEVRVIPFDDQFSKMSARDFFDKVLLAQHPVEFVAVGHDFNFGHNREGTPGKVVDWCQQRGISSRLIDPVESDGAPISSSRIRKLIQEGQVVSASRLLGRDYFLKGEVVHGDKRGRLLGFPTANVMPQVGGLSAPCLPARGVYLTSATVDGKTFASVTNLGVKPTVTEKQVLTLETHLLDYDGDLYGKLLTVEFRDRIRAEMKFNSIDELKQQIHIDTQKARSTLMA